MYLCKVDDLAELSTKQFEYNRLDERHHGFIVKWRGQLFAYENRCPHIGVELNWQENVFLNFDKTTIQCATHGAQFLFTDGLCVWGPCRGQSLTKLPLEIRSNQVYLVLSEL